MLFNAPLSVDRADRLIERLDLSPADRVLEVGCGRGALLLRLVHRWRCSAIGIDIDDAAVKAAQAQASQTELAVDFRCGDAKMMAIPQVDLAICIGATHAYGLGAGAWENTLRVFSRLVRPGGMMLIGEGFWAAPPAPAYLKFLGDSPGIEKTHHENVSSARRLRLLPLHAEVSSRDEWDAFEHEHHQAIKRAAAAQPGDDVLQQRQTQSQAWREGYLKWGRTTMGFGFYLLGVPAVNAHAVPQ
ncbi:MAG: class I SAM-dependent methyltransferase [Myxococcota bacterium]|nr:class I SAM-dependent methyltransferase [Myxococcota bacterium]